MSEDNATPFPKLKGYERKSVKLHDGETIENSTTIEFDQEPQLIDTIHLDQADIRKSMIEAKLRKGEF